MRGGLYINAHVWMGSGEFCMCLWCGCSPIGAPDSCPLGPVYGREWGRR